MQAQERRFGGIGRLYGRDGLERLRRSHVCVVGVGGVGSWAVEALARSGIGELTLIDADKVCLSNVNRQLHALDENLGQPLPPQARDVLGMMGFRIEIDEHGDLLTIRMPEMGAEDE